MTILRLEADSPERTQIGEGLVRQAVDAERLETGRGVERLLQHRLDDLQHRRHLVRRFEKHQRPGWPPGRASAPACAW